jgi:hypothetical protein
VALRLSVATAMGATDTVRMIDIRR